MAGDEVHMIYIILSTLGLIFVLVSILVLGFTRKITNPINEMAKFTEKLNSAKDNKEK
jgi:hypothetical protein